MHSNQERIIPVQPKSSESKTDSFTLQIPNQTNQTSQSQSTSNTPPNHNTASNKKSKSISNFIWSLLELASVAVIIFVIAFFAMNFDSYSRLFFSKVEQMRDISTGKNAANEIPLNQTNTQSTPQTEFLKVISNPTANRSGIGELNLNVLPPDNRIYIPRIKQNVPIISVSTERLLKRQWTALENEIQEALRDGVVHFPGTANPGEIGNTVITGHSSYFPWDPGRFKDVFALLHQVNIDDTIEVYHNQKRYVYKVEQKLDVTPDKVDVLLQGSDEKLTLITCTPVGTNLRRLIVIARPVKD